MISLPKSRPYSAINDSESIDGNSRIVLRVWSFETAAICTHAAECGTAMGIPSSSHPPKRHGPTNSVAQMAARNGSLPQPLSRRIVPCRRTNAPSASTSNQRSRMRTCSGVKRNGRPASGPSGWRR